MVGLRVVGFTERVVAIALARTVRRGRRGSTSTPTATEVPTRARVSVVPGVGPIWVGHDARQIEVRVDSGALAELRVDALHIDVAAGQEPVSRPAGAALARPGMISRAEWGAADWGAGVPDCGTGSSTAPGEVRRRPPHGRIQLVLAIRGLRHRACDPTVRDGLRGTSATSRTTSSSAATARLRRAQRQHLPDGDRRARPRFEHGQHRCRADGAIPARCAAQCRRRSRARSTQRSQSHRVEVLLAWHRSSCPGDDVHSCVSRMRTTRASTRTGTFLSIPPIVGHRDVSRTSCPGNNAYNLLPRLRAEVATARRDEWPVRAARRLPLGAEHRRAPSAHSLRVRRDPSRRWRGCGDRRRRTRRAGASRAISQERRLAARSSTVGAASGRSAPRRVSPHPCTGGAGTSRAGSRSRSSPTMGHVLDGWGGVRPFGGAATPTRTPYWKRMGHRVRHRDVARRSVAAMCSTAGVAYGRSVPRPA